MFSVIFHSLGVTEIKNLCCTEVVCFWYIIGTVPQSPSSYHHILRLQTLKATWYCINKHHIFVMQIYFIALQKGIISTHGTQSTHT